MIRRAAGAVVACALISGCGGPSADLFAVERSGVGPGANLRLEVQDGTGVLCNGKHHDLPAPQLLDARELSRQLQKAGSVDLNLPTGANQTFHYKVLVEAGTITFGDTSPGRTSPLNEITAFTRIVSTKVCKLPR